jgi:hypothetical protein
MEVIRKRQVTDLNRGDHVVEGREGRHAFPDRGPRRRMDEHREGGDALMLEQCLQQRALGLAIAPEIPAGLDGVARSVTVDTDFLGHVSDAIPDPHDGGDHAGDGVGIGGGVGPAFVLVSAQRRPIVGQPGDPCGNVVPCGEDRRSLRGEWGDGCRETARTGPVSAAVSDNGSLSGDRMSWISQTKRPGAASGSGPGPSPIHSCATSQAGGASMIRRAVRTDSDPPNRCRSERLNGVQSARNSKKISEPGSTSSTTMLRARLSVRNMDVSLISTMDSLELFLARPPGRKVPRPGFRRFPVASQENGSEGHVVVALVEGELRDPVPDLGPTPMRRTRARAR